MRNRAHDDASTLHYSGRESSFGICQITCTGKENWIHDCKILRRVYYCHNCLTNDIVGISCCKKHFSHHTCVYVMYCIHVALNSTHTTTTITTDSTVTTAASPTVQGADNHDHSNCTNENIHTSNSDSMPGIVAGAVGGFATLLIVAALLIGYLMYNCCCHRLQSTVREPHSNVMSESEPPPYQPPVAMDYVQAKSIYSLPKGSLSDPPPSYSSLAWYNNWVCYIAFYHF